MACMRSPVRPRLAPPGFMKTDKIISAFINSFYKKFPSIVTIIEYLDSIGASALLVGGAVRDALLEKKVDEIKDFDIEVYHISLDQLEEILAAHGPLRSVGKSFGVLKIDTLPIDWSIPRSDSIGRKPSVTIDPDMNFEKAFSRRDVTINAMGINLKTKELIDPFNGLEDLNKKILRSPDIKKFSEDPLRLLRVMQFVGRFDAT